MQQSAGTLSRGVWPDCRRHGLVLPQYAVEHPVGRSGFHTSAFAGADSLQVFYHCLDDWQLYIRRVGHYDACLACTRNKQDWIVVENRERQRPLVANDLYAVFLGTLVSHKAPASTAGNTALEVETSRDGVLCFIQMGTVCGIAVGTGDDSEDILQEVYLMWSQVVEIATS